MSNLNNYDNNCPGFMSDGRDSINTDYKSKNDTLAQMKGSETNSFDYRTKLQATGFSDISKSTPYFACSVVPYGNVVLPRDIKLGYDMSGNLSNAFKPLLSQ